MFDDCSKHVSLSKSHVQWSPQLTEVGHLPLLNCACAVPSACVCVQGEGGTLSLGTKSKTIFILALAKLVAFYLLILHLKQLWQVQQSSSMSLVLHLLKFENSIHGFVCATSVQVCCTFLSGGQKGGIYAKLFVITQLEFSMIIKYELIGAFCYSFSSSWSNLITGFCQK